MLERVGAEGAVFPEVHLTREYIGRCWDLVNEVRRGWGWRGGSNNGMKGYSVIMDGVNFGAAFFSTTRLPISIILLGGLGCTEHWA